MLTSDFATVPLSANSFSAASSARDGGATSRNKQKQAETKYPKGRRRAFHFHKEKLDPSLVQFYSGTAIEKTKVNGSQKYIQNLANAPR